MGRIVGVLVGSAGWSYADWSGVVYPDPRPRGFSELGFLASLVDLIEINTTFYRPPPPRLAEGWVRKTPPGFPFTAKIWQRLTHAPEPVDASIARPYRSGIAPLIEAGTLRALLAQFPWSFRDTPENRDRIRLLREIFADLPLVVEVRHSSWNRPEALEFFRRRAIGFCNIDQPASRTGITGTRHVTSDPGYVRLHGRNARAWFDRNAGRDEKYDYLYSEAELKNWVQAIQEMKRRTASVFVVANNHFRGKGIVNALQLKAALTGKRVNVPPNLLRAYPQLQAVATPSEPHDLF